MKLVSRYQELNTPDVLALKEFLHMPTIFRYQKLSDDFVIDHTDELESDDVDICETVIPNHNLSDKVVKLIYKRRVLRYLNNICKSESKI